MARVRQLRGLAGHLLVLSIAAALLALAGPTRGTGASASSLNTPTPAMLRGSGVMRVRSPDGHPVIGVATYNVRGPNPVATKVADMRRLSRRPGVDLIGFQETYDNDGAAAVRAALTGPWAYFQDTAAGNSAEDTVAWRTTKFALVRAASYRGSEARGAILARRFADGDPPTDPDRPFPARYSTVVVLRSLATGRTVELIDVHTNQFVEKYDLGLPGHPYDNANATGARGHLRQIRALIEASTADYTFVTGDFNWGYVADRHVRARGFMSSEIVPVAVPSYLSLGVRGLPATLLLPGYPAYVDYVLAKRGTGAGFYSQRVLTTHYHSDHRPLVVRFVLR